MNEVVRVKVFKLGIFSMETFFYQIVVVIGYTHNKNKKVSYLLIKI